MTAFTRIGATLWSWEPWTSLRAPGAQLLWLGLYSSSEARRHAPGLWQGGIPAMAEATSMLPDVIVDALDLLIERHLVEYDQKYRVLRLCELPDPGEFPANGNGIRSWWTRFQSVPSCDVRDAHVTTLRWILDEGARQRGKPLTPDHESAWKEKFGGISIPAPRRRGVRRLLDSDTSTQSQPSLFSSPGASGSGSGNGSSEAPYPQDPQGGVDNSAALHQLNKNNSPETVPGTVRGTYGIPDLGSRILDLSGEGGGGGGKPVLALVPPYTAQQVLHELKQGLWDPADDQTHHDALGALVPVWVSRRVTLDDFRVLAQHSRHSGQRRSLRWILGCDLLEQIRQARLVMDWRDVRAEAVRESLP